MEQQDNLSPEERQALSQGAKLLETCQTPGWVEVLQPYLQSKLTNSWVDPRKAKDDEDFVRQYNIAWAFAQAAEEILGFISTTQDAVSKLRQKEKGEIVDKLRQSVS